MSATACVPNAFWALCMLQATLQRENARVICDSSPLQRNIKINKFEKVRVIALPPSFDFMTSLTILQPRSEPGSPDGGQGRQKWPWLVGHPHSSTYRITGAFVIIGTKALCFAIKWFNDRTAAVRFGDDSSYTFTAFWVWDTLLQDVGIQEIHSCSRETVMLSIATQHTDVPHCHAGPFVTESTQDQHAPAVSVSKMVTPTDSPSPLGFAPPL